MKDVKLSPLSVCSEVRDTPRVPHSINSSLGSAGLCVQDAAQRAEVISLIKLCEARIGWPMSTMREDLYKEWNKVDSDEKDEDTRITT
jgi:hypothetical protein